MDYIEVSAKTGMNISIAFSIITNNLVMKLEVEDKEAMTDISSLKNNNAKLYENKTKICCCG